MQVQKTKQGYKKVKWLFGKKIEIPEEWEILKLSKLCEKENDIVAGPFGSNLVVNDYVTNGVPIIRLQNIGRNQFIEKNIKFINKEKAEELKYHSYMPEDLVLAKLGDPIGKTCRIPKDFPAGIVVADVVRIRTSLKKSNSDFIEYILNSWICEKQFNMEKIGTTRPRVNLEQIRNLVFPCPPIKEQQKIASILSNIDSLIQQTQKEIDLNKKLKKGLMNQLLTRGIGHNKFKKVKWLFGKEIEIPTTWEIKLLKEITEKIGDGIHATPDYTENSPYYFINGNNLINGTISFFDSTKTVSIGEYKNYQLDLGNNTVFLSINGTIGNVAVFNNEKIVLGKSVCYINCTSKLKRQFIFYVLQSQYLQKFFNRELTGTTISNLSLFTVRSSPILLPEIQEQQKIASILSNVDTYIQTQQEYKTHLESLKKGLMQKLLTGKIRVSV